MGVDFTPMGYGFRTSYCSTFSLSKNAWSQLRNQFPPFLLPQRTFPFLDSHGNSPNNQTPNNGLLSQSSITQYKKALMVAHPLSIVKHLFPPHIPSPLHLVLASTRVHVLVLGCLGTIHFTTLVEIF